MLILQMRKLRLEEPRRTLKSSTGFFSRSPGPGPHSAAGPVGEKQETNLKLSGDERAARERKQVEGEGVQVAGWSGRAFWRRWHWGLKHPGGAEPALPAGSQHPLHGALSTGACSHLKAFAPAVLIPPPRTLSPQVLLRPLLLLTSHSLASSPHPAPGCELHKLEPDLPEALQAPSTRFKARSDASL